MKEKTSTFIRFGVGSDGVFRKWTYEDTDSDGLPIGAKMTLYPHVKRKVTNFKHQFYFTFKKGSKISNNVYSIIEASCREVAMAIADSNYGDNWERCLNDATSLDLTILRLYKEHRRA